jgi:hypothetical protein
LGESHKVGIFDSSGALLVSTIIPSGTGSLLEGHFRYADIAPLKLDAGQTYTASAFHPTRFSDVAGGADLNDILVNPAISLPTFPGRFIHGGTDLEFPTSIATNEFNGSPFGFNPNFLLTPVPIPPTIWLLGSGLLGLVGFRKKFLR